MNRPSVSVIIPTYNRSDTLARAIESVIAQTFRDWELVVVDDGSTDATPQLLEKYHAKLGDRFIGIRQQNLGCSAARNRGIDLCRGHFVAFLDSDDEFLPQKLERQLELFAACPGLTFVYSDYAFVDLEGKRTASAITAKFALARTMPARSTGVRLYELGPELFETLLRGYFIATIVGLVRRDALGVIRFDEGLSYSEEWLFYLRLARSGRAGFVDEPLALHHFTRNSLSRTNKLHNLVRQCQLFHAIKKQLPELTRYEIAIVHDHLARANSQLAINHRAAGNPVKAMVSAAKAYYYGSKWHDGAAATERTSQGREFASDIAYQQSRDQVGCMPAR